MGAKCFRPFNKVGLAWQVLVIERIKHHNQASTCASENVKKKIAGA